MQPAKWEKNESHLPLMRVIFVIFSRLKWKYVKIMEVQEVTVEVQEESVLYDSVYYFCSYREPKIQNLNENYEGPLHDPKRKINYTTDKSMVQIDKNFTVSSSTEFHSF